MSSFDVKVSGKVNIVMQLPKKELAEKGITPENSVVVILSPNSVKCEILKKFLILKNHAKVLNHSSRFMAIIPNEEYMRLVTECFNDETLTKFEKDKKISYLSEDMLTPDKNFRVTIPLEFHSLFTGDNFKLVTKGKNCGVYSESDLTLIANLVTQKSKTKVDTAITPQ